MNQLPTVEGIGRGWVEVTPSGHGPTTPYEIRAAASEARRSGDAASMFDVNDTPRNDAPPAPAPEPSKATSIVGAVVGAVKGLFASTDVAGTDPKKDDDMPETFGETLEAIKRVQAEAPSGDGHVQADQRRRLEQLLQHSHRLQNASPVAIPRCAITDGIWSVLRADGEIKTAAAAVNAAHRDWQEKVVEFSKEGLLGNAREILQRLDGELSDCVTPDDLAAHAGEVARLKSITRHHEIRAAGIVQAAFSCIGAPYEQLLNAADDKLSAMEREAVVAESRFFQSFGLKTEQTSVSRRFNKARAHVAHLRGMLKGFRGEDSITESRALLATAD